MQKASGEAGGDLNAGFEITDNSVVSFVRSDLELLSKLPWQDELPLTPPQQWKNATQKGEMMKKYLMIVLMLVAVVGMTACQKDTPAEKAAQSTEDTVKESSTMEKVGEKVDGVVEKTAEEAQKMKEAVVDAVKEDGTMEKMGEKVDEVVEKTAEGAQEMKENVLDAVKMKKE